MSIAICLRKTAPINYFHDLLVGSINTGLGNNVLLCSSFFEEKNSFHVSNYNGFDQLLLNNNIKLTAVGIYKRQRSAFQDFITNLTNAGVAVTGKRISACRWHAKVYILCKGDRPIFGIIGSSNMTKNAFAHGTSFNYEADVFMWLDEFSEFSKLINDLFQENKDEVIIVDYNEAENANISIENRLRDLMAEILSSKFTKTL